MPLASNLQISFSAEQTASNDLGASTFAPSLQKLFNLATGTGSGQADLLFTDTRSISSSSSEDLDLAGSLTDAFGNTLTFAKVKLLAVFADAGNGDNIEVGGASSAQFLGPFKDSSHIAEVPAGGGFIAYSPAGYTVTATSADLLKVANADSGDAGRYTIIIVGTSA